MELIAHRKRSPRKNLSWVIAGMVIIISIFIYANEQPSPVTYPAIDNTILIAHAGGGLDIGNYSNSREALEQSLENGYKYIEVDLSQTQNKDWVLIHDWGKIHAEYFYSFIQKMKKLITQTPLKKPVSAEDFQTLNMQHDLTPMTLDSLIVWLKEHPEIKIITDISGSNYDCLKLIKNMMDGNTNQIIPQIYTPEEYDRVKSLGYTDIILTVYKLTLDKDKLAELTQFSADVNLFAMTVPKKWINEDIKSWHTNTALPIFTHTINDISKAERFKALGASGFYTDYLVPAAAPASKITSNLTPNN